MSIRRFLSATPACLLAAGVAIGTLGAEPDADTGLAVAPGWEDVRVHCGACHSFGLITNQRANREGWRDMIRWMQRTQNLWELPAESETRILDYLAENYAPQALRQRRPPIPPELMPASDDPREPATEGAASKDSAAGS